MQAVGLHRGPCREWVFNNVLAGEWAHADTGIVVVDKVGVLSIDG